MENNHSPSGDLMVKRKRGRPRKNPTIESNVQSIGPLPGLSMTQPHIHPRDNVETMVGEQPHLKNNYTPSRDFMVKPKRGRPRKYSNIESNVQSTGPPPPPGFRMNQPQIGQRDNDEAMVGQAIRGVVEATFEDGFFLSVKVEDSDSMLKGVVFKPGCCVPVSVHNDVAPHLPMIRRNMVHPHASGNRARKYTVSESHGSGEISLAPVPIQPAHLMIPTHRVAPIVRRRSLVPVPSQPAQPGNSAQLSVVLVPALPAQRALVPVPTPPAQLDLPTHPIIPAHHVVPIVLQPVHQQNGDGGVPMQPAHQVIIRNPVVSVKRQPPHLCAQLPVNRGPMQTETHSSQGQ